MSECYGCGQIHPNEPCANTLSDFLIPLVGILAPVSVLGILALSQIGGKS